MTPKCPKCGSIIYSRRNVLCGVCGERLPPELLFSPEQRAAVGRTADIIRMSLLDTFTIEGTPIGDWQAGAARAWARTTGRHVRWVEMLTNNMPATDPIRRWTTPDEAQSLWQRAAREGDDA